MSENVLDYLYPEDQTGEAVTNRVGPEYHTLNPPTENGDFHFIIPHAGPYYRNTLVLKHRATGRELIRGMDWYPAHRFNSASFELQDLKGGLYMTILFTDRTLAGEVEITSYQNIGGPWTLSHAKILEILANKANDPRTATYEEVADRPDVFKLLPHDHNVADMTGMTEQVAATLEVARAIREQTSDLPVIVQQVLQQFYDKTEVDQILSDMVDTVLYELSGSQREAIMEQVRELMTSEYYTKTAIDQIIAQINLALADRVTLAKLQQDLANYHTKTEITAILSDYVTSTALGMALQGIRDTTYTRTDIDALADAIYQQLNDRYTKAVVDQMVAAANLSRQQGDAALQQNIDSLAQSVANTFLSYYTKSQVNEILTGYVTSTALTSTLANYVTGAALANATAGKAKQLANTAAAGGAVDLILAAMAASDHFRVRVGGDADNGWVEIATADNGNEEILVRQYTGAFTTIARTLKLLDVNGNTHFPGTVYTPYVSSSGNVAGFSDIRVKTNVERIVNALEKTCTLLGATWDRTDMDLRQAGTIAQMVQKVLPEAVVEGPDGRLSVVDAALSGLFIESFKEVDEMLQEQSKIIALQAKQIEALGERLSALEDSNKNK